MKAIVYLYWRFLRTNTSSTVFLNKTVSILQFSGIVALFILALLGLSDSILGSGFIDLIIGLDSNSTLRRYKILLFLLPLFALVILFFYINRQKVNTIIASFENSTEIEKKRMNRSFIIFVIASILFFLAATTSGAWVKSFKP